jgi:hypothetical protein
VRRDFREVERSLDPLLRGGRLATRVVAADLPVPRASHERKPRRAALLSASLYFKSE